ncbi:MAG: hypothetical protein ACM32O_09340 [Clostridia bacterium]
MNQLLSLLMITAFVGMLCAAFWSTDVEKQVMGNQEDRIKQAATLIFH